MSPLAGMMPFGIGYSVSGKITSFRIKPMKPTRIALLLAGTISLSYLSAAVAQDEPVVRCWEYGSVIEKKESVRLGVVASPQGEVKEINGYYKVYNVPITLTDLLDQGRSTSSRDLEYEVKVTKTAAGSPFQIKGFMIDTSGLRLGEDLPELRTSSTYLTENTAKPTNISKPFHEVAMRVRFTFPDGTSLEHPFELTGAYYDILRTGPRFGTYAPNYVPIFRRENFLNVPTPWDASATAPLLDEVLTKWQDAGTVTIEYIAPETDRVLLTSEPQSWPFANVDAALAPLQADAMQDLAAGKCR